MPHHSAANTEASQEYENHSSQNRRSALLGHEEHIEPKTRAVYIQDNTVGHIASKKIWPNDV